MINPPWLLLDVMNLGWKAFHSTGQLSYKNQSTGVMFGILRDVALLQRRFDTDKICFCFDLGESYRCNLYKDYKSARKVKYASMSEQEQNQTQEVRRQIHELRRLWLPKLGFSNVFFENGYEADDIIASLCKTLKDEDIIIVSSDQDLYQCLRGNISIYQPQQEKIVTLQKFFAEYGVKPKEWPKVKAWMGDIGDSIPGVYGVGIKKALKLVDFKHDNAVILNTSAQKKLHEAICVHQCDGSYQRNLDLVTLPWPGTPKYTPKEDSVTKKKWRKLCQQFGFESLEKLYPMSARKKALNED